MNMELDFLNKELYEMPTELISIIYDYSVCLDCSNIECKCGLDKGIISESVSLIYDFYNFCAHLCFLK